MKGESTSTESDSFRTYFREISQFPLVTPEEEIELSVRIKAGDEEAYSQLLCANLRLVVKIALKFSDRGLSLMDMIAEANRGLMQAVERFEPGHGAKFSTYAAWWIKQSIQRALGNQGRTVRLPIHLIDKIWALRRVSGQMSEELGRDPTNEEVAEEMGVTPQRVAHLRNAAMSPLSLDAPIHDDDSTELVETIGDWDAQSPFEQASASQLCATLLPLIDILSERERAVIVSRYGLDGKRAKTLDAIGKKFGITRERIRQVQEIALTKLRKAMRKKDNYL